MILAAAACAAGLSYIFNDDDQSTSAKYETVTVSSTIIDKQGIVKYVIHPRVLNPVSFIYYPFVNQVEKGNVLYVHEHKLNQQKLPTENKKQQHNFLFQKRLSIIFFWSIPLKAHLLQTPRKSCLIIENSNYFERNLMKISIGIQNVRRRKVFYY